MPSESEILTAIAKVRDQHINGFLTAVPREGTVEYDFGFGRGFHCGLQKALDEIHNLIKEKARKDRDL